MPYTGDIVSMMSRTSAKAPLMTTTENGVRARVEGIVKEGRSALVPTRPWASADFVVEHVPDCVLLRMDWNQSGPMSIMATPLQAAGSNGTSARCRGTYGVAASDCTAIRRRRTCPTCRRAPPSILVLPGFVVSMLFPQS